MLTKNVPTEMITGLLVMHAEQSVIPCPPANPNPPFRSDATRASWIEFPLTSPLALPLALLLDLFGQNNQS